MKYSPKQIEVVEKARKVCVERNQPDPALLAKAYAGESIDDKKVKEYVICVSKEHGVMLNDAADLSEDAYYALFPEAKEDPKGAPGFAKCKGLTRDTPFETQYIRAMCVFGLTSVIYAN